KTGDVVVMNADGSGRAQLTQHAAGTFAAAPCWSPDGRRLAFMTVKGLDGELFVIDADGKNRTPLGPGVDPIWSPAGKTLLYSALPTGKKEPVLHIMEADGKSPRALGVVGAQAKWSPDGKLIVFAGIVGGKNGIAVMSADGADAKVLREAEGAFGLSGAQW